MYWGPLVVVEMELGKGGEWNLLGKWDIEALAFRLQLAPKS